MEPAPTGPFNPPPQAPFNPGAAQAGRRRGCTKPMIVGCLVLVLGGGILVLGGLYYVATHLGVLLERSFAMVETSMDQVMPPDVTPAERQRLHDAFVSARAAMAHPDKVDPTKLSRLQTELFNVSRKGKSLTRDDVLHLTEALEAVSTAPPAAPAPGAPASPAPPPAPSPPASDSRGSAGAGTSGPTA
jgi:hypothetical protein